MDKAEIALQLTLSRIGKIKDTTLDKNQRLESNDEYNKFLAEETATLYNRIYEGLGIK